MTTMKLMHIAVHFEYTDAIQQILDEHAVAEYVVYPMMEGKDRDGRHEGTQTFPGNITVFHAQVSEERIDALFASLQQFRQAKQSHRHLQAVALPIERSLAAEHPLRDATAGRGGH